MAETHESIFLAVGPAILDVSAVVNDGFLERFGLELNVAISAEDKHKTMFQELFNRDDVKYIAGGDALTVAKTLGWMLRQPGAAIVFGSIGQDFFGLKMKNAARADGLNAQFYEDENTSTGVCAVCLVGGARAWVVDPSAALNYKSDHLKRPENWASVEKAKYFFVSGSFLATSPELIQILGKHAAENNKVFIMSLGSPFIRENLNKDALENALPYMDFVFANETEARAFSRVLGWETDNTGEIALRLSQWPKASEARKRTVVVTYGAVPVCVAEGGNVKRFPATDRPKDKLLDSNAAGDAFVGGFISQLVQEKPIEECIKAGWYAANMIICDALTLEYLNRIYTIYQAYMGQVLQP